MLKIILGDTSCGKSEKICRQLVAQSVAMPDSRFIAIVPEQATLLMQKNLIAIHPKQLITNIEIVSFEFLAQMVFAELGKTTSSVLDDTGKALILRKLLDDVKEDLLVYGRKVRMPGFVEEIKSIITELKQYDIDDNALFLMQEAAQQSGAGLLYSKLQDIRLIYRKFNEEIENKYTTPEELLDIFARLVPESVLLKDAIIFLDGFTGFTPVQYKLLAKLLETSADMTMAITLPEYAINENCPEYDLFYLSNRTYSKMKELASQAGCELQMEVCCADPEKKEQKNYRVKIFAAQTITEEVTFTAARILEMIRSGECRFRDIAVVVSDMETYFRPVKTIFEEAGISCFMDHKTRLSQNAVSHFLLAALQLLEERFSYDTLFSCLKSGMTDLSVEEVGKIENYCLEFGIKGIRAFREDFFKNRQRGALWDLEELNVIRKRVMQSIGSFYASLSRKNTAADYYGAVKKLFDNCSVQNKIAEMSARFAENGQLALGKEYEQIYEQVMELLEKIKNLLGDEQLSAGDYADIVAQGLEEIKVGVIPPSLDAVVVGDLTRTRLSGIKTLFLLGANEGKIPAEGSGSSAVFTQKERAFLKTNDFEIAPTTLENIYTQRFYIYLMLTKPENHLWISWPQVAADGTSLQPSYILEDLKELLPGMQIEEENGQCEQMWEKRRLDQLAETIEDPDEALLNYIAKERPERLAQILAAAFFTNRQNALDEKLAEELYGKILLGSVSRYEKYAECPFKHFMQYGLGIEKRPEYQVEATDIGTIYHDSLERYSKKLAENGQTFRDISDEESHQLISACVEEAIAGMESDIMASTARNEYLMKRIHLVARKTTDVLRQHVKDGKYEPAYYELQFRTGLSPDVQFTGKIDRVDIYDGNDVFVKIIDYKSGKKEFDAIDIYSGLQLQLVAYLNEALKTAKETYPEKNVQPGGIYYYLIQDRFVKNEDEANKKYIMKGVTNCDPEALAAIDKNVGADNPGSSHIVEISYTKSGAQASSSKVANQMEFSNLLEFVNQKILKISQQIRQGDVSVKPVYKEAKKNACRFCDYKDVCKFEDGCYGTTWDRTAEEITKEDAANLIFGRSGWIE